MDEIDEWDEMEMPSLSGSFLNQEASVSMPSLPVEEEDEDEDLYYVEPRRPSLDLGPVEATLLYERAKSPADSYLSMSSEGLGPVQLSEEDQSCTKIQLIRTDSFSSCYTVDSEDCEIRTKVKGKEISDENDALPELKEIISDEPPPYLTIEFVFKAICEVLQQLTQVGLELFLGHLWHRYPQSFSSSLHSMDIVDIVDRMLECYSVRVSLQITKAVLLQLEQKRLIDHLENLEKETEVHYYLRERLKKMFEDVECPGGEKRPLAEVYADLHIVSEDDNGPNLEHEVMSIKRLNDNKDIKDLCIADITDENYMVTHREQMIVLLGAAGSGKSMAVRKLIQEWSNETPKRFKLMFVFMIKELKQTFGDSHISFLDILHHFYPETKRLDNDLFTNNRGTILYIFDGLEDISEDLAEEEKPYVWSVDKVGTLCGLINSILKDTLLRHNFVLLTTRPMPRYYIPFDTNHKVLEVLGFKEEAKEEYFRKRFRDPRQAERVIAYVKSSRTLQIMCHLPLFCSVLSDFCQSVFDNQGLGAELPKGITHMYTRLLLALMFDHHTNRKVPVDPLKFIMAIGKRAFSMLEKGEYYLCISYKGASEKIDEFEATAYSGLGSVFLTRSNLFMDDKMFCFVHSTMQEYMAALYVFLKYLIKDKNVFDTAKRKMSFKLSFKKNPIDLIKCALERSLLCEDGKLDIFLRFLFGMTNSSNTELLQRFFKPTVKWSSEEAGALIRKKLSENQYPARNKNLQLCLEELDLQKQEARKRSFKR